MRIADKMISNQVTSNLQKNRSEMYELQNQAATQKRLTKPSDDPTASARVLAARTEERGSGQYIKNINVARSFLESTDQSLSEFTESLMRLKELAIQQANDAGASGDTRRTVAAEVAQIYNQAIQIGNRKLGDRFIFAGHQTNRMPFDRTGSYSGDSGEIQIQVNKSAFVPMNVSGDMIFLGKGLGPGALISSKNEVPRTIEDLQNLQEKEADKILRESEKDSEIVELRAPSDLNSRRGSVISSVPDADSSGVNVLQTIKNFEMALQVNDKEGIQIAIDQLDDSITQIVNARAQVGARIMALNAAQDSLQKAVVESKITASQNEDVDLFQVVSDMNKTDSTLRATLETSGKVANLSLLDFLK
jgi:flagellar hook-associated protein 3 FlgL